MFLVYSRFGLYRCLVYSRFGLSRFLVYSRFGLSRFLVYSRFGLYRFLVYSRFGLSRFHCICSMYQHDSSSIDILKLNSKYCCKYCCGDGGKLWAVVKRGGGVGALGSDSTHHFFRNACTKSGTLRFSQFSGC